jgi:DNA polymerase-3 subunit gamma/tau
MYQVLARKWRPQSLGEVVGQAHIVRTLGNALRARRIAHAFVFSGLRGVGKTTVARILAKCLNCENGPAPEPCNACTPCRETTEGRCLDVLEMDAASRTGIDDIRDLQEVVAYAPARDRYKVLILDEAHMLSTKAFNALLKTLEEPPPQVVFVLATTEIQKLPPTILSRCQIFDFRRVPAREVAAHLRKVCGQEEISVSDAIVDRIARAGEGSVRDSLSVLERVRAFCGNEIADAEAMQVLGAVREETLVRMVRGLAERDAAGLLRTLDELLDEGHDLVHFWNEMIVVLRDLLLLRSVPDRTDLLARAPEEASALSEAASGLTREDLTRAFQILADAEVPLRNSSQPRYLFEALLIRLASLGTVRPIEEILSALRGSTAQDAPADRPPSSPTARPQKKKGSEPAGAAAVDLTEHRSDPDLASSTPAANEGPARTWRRRVTEASPLLGAALEQASVRFQDGAFIVTFGPDLEAVRKIAEREDNLALLRRHAEDASGQPSQVRIAGGQSAASVAPPPAPAPRSPDPARGAETPPRGRRPIPSTPRLDKDLLDRARSEPGVRKLLTEFGAQIVDIRPLEPPRGEENGLAEPGAGEEPT